MLIKAKAIDWKWPHFTPWELRADRDDARRDKFETFLDSEFLDKLERLRVVLGFPLIVASYYRSPEYNDAHSGTGLTGPHTTGRAIDIQIYGGRMFDLLAFLKLHKFTGVGVRQHGPRESRFIHLDDLPHGPGCPRPWGWSYS